MTYTYSNPDNEAIARHYEQRVRQYRSKMQLMDSDERLTLFLQKCNQPGVHSTRDRFPTLTKLAYICCTNPSTINRIASGTTRHPCRTMLKILNAVAGICPYAPVNDDLTDEIKKRVADGERWRKTSTSFDKAELIKAIQKGITTRQIERAMARAAKQGAPVDLMLTRIRSKSTRFERGH